MPVTSAWDTVDDRIYIVTCSDLWTWDDFEHEIDKAYRLLGSLPHDVDFVMQFNNYMPPGDAQKHLSYAGEQPKNIRHTALLNEAGNLMKMIFKKVDKQEGWDGPAFTGSIEQTREVIDKQRRIHKTGKYAE